MRPLLLILLGSLAGAAVAQTARSAVSVTVPYLLEVAVDAYEADHLVLDGAYVIEARVRLPLSVRLATNGSWTLTLTHEDGSAGSVSGAPGLFEPLDLGGLGSTLRDGERITLRVVRD